MYRVYDNKEHCWVNKGIYISPNDGLSISKKVLFGTEKLNLVSNKRYTFHRDIGLHDKNNILIFEGDICKITTDDSEVIGIVAYCAEHASYYIFDYINSHYYTMGLYKCDKIEVIGNVLDDDYLLFRPIEK